RRGRGRLSGRRGRRSLRRLSGRFWPDGVGGGFSRCWRRRRRRLPPRRPLAFGGRSRSRSRARPRGGGWLLRFRRCGDDFRFLLSTLYEVLWNALLHPRHAFREQRLTLARKRLLCSAEGIEVMNGILNAIHRVLTLSAAGYAEPETQKCRDAQWMRSHGYSWFSFRHPAQTAPSAFQFGCARQLACLGRL